MAFLRGSVREYRKSVFTIDIRYSFRVLLGICYLLSQYSEPTLNSNIEGSTDPKNLLSKNLLLTSSLYDFLKLVFYFLLRVG